MLDAFLILFGLMALLGGLGTIMARHPIHAAMALVLTFLSTASIYALLDAHLLAAIQIIVYVGAIMVLIVYTILLMDIKDEDLGRGWTMGRAVGGALAVVWGLVFLTRTHRISPKEAGASPEGFGTVEGIAWELFTDYLYVFELVSVLLLAGIVGALVLAMREKAADEEGAQ